MNDLYSLFLNVKDIIIKDIARESTILLNHICAGFLYLFPSTQSTLAKS